MPRIDEHWLPVPGWAGYEVSDHGQVRSLPRLLANGRRHGGLVLRQRPDRKGYLTVTLAESFRRRTVRVHVLVMLAFAGPPPPDRPQVRHLNGKPADNRWPQNLAYGDQADQEADKARKGLAGPARRRRAGGAKPGRSGLKARSRMETASRALATVAQPASALPHETLRPAVMPVSSQVATGRASAAATARPQARRRS